MLTNWLDGFPVVLDALWVFLEITALLMGTTEGGTFETPHNHLDGGHMLTTLTYNLEIVGLYWWFVAKGNHTHVVDTIDWCVSQNNWLWQWEVMNNYLMILNCHQHIISCKLGYLVEAYVQPWWSSVCWHALWILVVVNYNRCTMWYRLNWDLVDYIPDSSDPQHNERLFISQSIVTNLGVSLHLTSLKPTRLGKQNPNETHGTCPWNMLQFIY